MIKHIEQLSFQYSFKKEYNLILFINAIAILGVLAFFILFLIDDYTPKWHGLFIIVPVIITINNIFGFRLKEKTVKFDSEYIYVIDRKNKQTKYNIGNLIALNRLFLRHYVLKIRNEMGNIDTIYLFVYPQGSFFLTKEAKNLIQYAEVAKNEKVHIGWSNIFIFK